MSKCGRCGGLVMDPGDGEPRCSACGRPAQPATPEAVDGPVTINIQLKPKNLVELYSALAITQGKNATQFLESLGITPAQAKSMASGDTVVPAAAVVLMERYAITPSDLVSLMKGQTRVDIRKRRPGPKPRSQQE